MSASASSLVCLLLASFVSVGGLESDADFGSDGLVNVIVATSSKEDLADRVFVLETLLAKTTDQLTEFQIKTEMLLSQWKESQQKIQELELHLRRVELRAAYANASGVAVESDPDAAFQWMVDALERRIGAVEAESRLRETEKWLHKSCEEIRFYNPFLPSGVYKIDPDGANVGDASFPVYCNMTTGSTVIWHDCVDSCWQQPVFYNVTARQVMSLIQQSGDCVQSLELPLECASSHRFSQTEAIGHSNTSVWLDRHGQRHTFADYCLNPKSSENGCCTALALKGALPVTQLHVDDVKVRRPMRLGPLECRGIFRGEKGDRGPVGPKGDPGPRGGGKICPNDIGPSTSCHDREPFSCYCLVRIHQTWNQAAEFCRSRDMQLVSLETLEEDQMLRKLTGNVGFPWWWSSAVRDTADWLWTGTGKRLTYTDWAKGHPHSPAAAVAGEQSRAVALLYRGRGWFDMPANGSYYSICESP